MRLTATCFATLLLVTSASPAWAKPEPAPEAGNPADCSLTYRSDEDTATIVDKAGFGFKQYDALCAKLVAEGLGIDIIADRGTVEKQAYSWTVATLYDRETGIKANLRSQNTVLADAATTDLKDMTMHSVDSAIEAIATNPGEYVAAVRSEVAGLTAKLAAGGKH